MSLKRDSQNRSSDSVVNKRSAATLVRRRRDFGLPSIASRNVSGDAQRMPAWLVDMGNDQFECKVRTARVYFAVGEFGAMLLSAAFWLTVAVLLTHHS